MGDLLLVRHGETEWARTGQHTGLTDVPLTAHGEEQAAALEPVLARRSYALVLSSPLQRARRTGELAGLAPVDDADLLEWDNGDYEGITTAQIREQRGDQWWLFTDGAPGGESPEQVQVRCDRVVERVAPALTGGDVVLFGHGHSLRALAAVWVGLPASQGGILTMDPASVAVLGSYHGHRVIHSWGTS